MHLVSALGLLVCVVVLKSSDMTVSSGVIITTPAKKEVTGTERVETTAAERATTPRRPVDLGEQTKAASGNETTTAPRSDERTTRAGPQNIEETRNPVTGTERVETTTAERATTQRRPVDIGEQTKAASGNETTTAPRSDERTTRAGPQNIEDTKKPVTGTVETTTAERATTQRRPVDLGEQTKAAATTAGKEATTAARSDERTTRAGPQNIEETREPVSGAAVPEGDKVLISCPDVSIERLDNGTCFSPNAPINRNNVFCPFVDQEGCLRSDHPANHCSGCFQENDLCADGVGRQCNQACIERGYAKGVCENVSDKRCPCLLVGYRACYCYKRSLEGEHTTQGPK